MTTAERRIVLAALGDLARRLPGVHLSLVLARALPDGEVEVRTVSTLTARLAGEVLRQGARSVESGLDEPPVSALPRELVQ